MKTFFVGASIFIGTSVLLVGQEPSLLDPQGIRQAIAAEKDKTTPADATPRASDITKLPPIPPQDSEGDPGTKKDERARQANELKVLKAREGGPRRFAQDLFDTREEMPNTTEGGIAEDYLLGIGDHLQIVGLGSATFELPAPINGQGNVLIPKVGTVRVSGLTLAKARTAIQAKVNQQLAGTTVEVSVTKLRQIRVFILGEVYKPGSYLVPSLSSLVSVLSLAGGPSAMGSFRQIQIIRGGKSIHQIDLYPLRAFGLGNFNFSLQNGDTLFVPLAFNPAMLEGRFVRVAGSLVDTGMVSNRAVAQKRPDGPTEVVKETIQAANPESPMPSMQFEFLPGETVGDALRFAGGLLPNAYEEGLTMRRDSRSGGTSVEDIPITKASTVEILRGDVLSALPRREHLEHLVTVTGWARVPGRFARTPGLRVSALLKREAQLMPDTYLKRGNIIRTLPDGSTRYLAFDVAKAMEGDPASDLLLEDRDRLELYQLERMRQPETVTLSGPFTQAGAYEFNRGMRVADLIFRAGVPTKNANQMSAELARSRNGKPSEIRQLDLSRLISTETGSPVNLADDINNPLLQDDDQITIFEKPEFRIHRSVWISGQIAKPGNYILDSTSPTLSQLLDRAGGLTPEAMPAAGILFRNLLSAEQKPFGGPTRGYSKFGEILERLNEAKIYDFKSDNKSGMTSIPSILKLPIMHGLDLKQMNRVVVDFNQAIAKNPDADIELQDGDEIVIPRRTDTAILIGETATPFAVYKVGKGLKVRDLLKIAGGTTRNADLWNVRLLRADGHIIDQGVMGQIVEPGDAVLVPQIIHRATSWQESLTALTPIAIMINAIRR